MYVYSKSTGRLVPKGKFPSAFGLCVGLVPEPQFHLVTVVLDRGVYQVQSITTPYSTCTLERTVDDLDCIYGRFTCKHADLSFEQIKNLYLEVEFPHMRNLSTRYPVLHLNRIEGLSLGPARVVKNSVRFPPNMPVKMTQSMLVYFLDQASKGVGLTVDTSEDSEEDDEDEDEEEAPPPPVRPPLKLKPHTLQALIAAEKGKECPISYMPIESTTAAVTSCQHVFQRSAITHWLSSHTNCPVCREECELIGC